ncbi:MAG: cyclic pyranopterin monophosphate synthase MoaC [Synergistaceae bacterium]|jgi:cyclic pyranopterin phosphate synthase|nr:cyclic pyranopterin monophosphate synthase MoaC [Synergistaceae bacterium]
MGEWNHFDDDGKPSMVDIGGKPPTSRTAAAEGWVDLPEAIYDAITKNGVSKGDPVMAAELGGIMGAKRTSELIPLCHGIRLDKVSVRCEIPEGARSLRIVCEAAARDSTGVEMEALTGVSVAALVFYDMCKGIDKGMVIRGVRLLKKTGGKSGTWKAGGQFG